MDEAIDYNAVIAQLQLENEMLRRALGPLSDVQATVYKIPEMTAHLWHKAIQNKWQLIGGLMILYWVLTVIFLIYDRWPR
jgi:hypothetical protein